jgi:hypothetical protein
MENLRKMKQKTLKDLRERYAVKFFLGFGVFISQILATNFSFLPLIWE